MIITIRILHTNISGIMRNIWKLFKLMKIIYDPIAKYVTTQIKKIYIMWGVAYTIDSSFVYLEISPNKDF